MQLVVRQIQYICTCIYMYMNGILLSDEFGGGGGEPQERREGGEAGEGEGGGWDVDDVLDIPEDIGDVGPAVSGEEGYFVPPTKGTPPSQASNVYKCSTRPKKLPYCRN